MIRRGPMLVALLVALTGCRQDMADRVRQKPLEASRFFADGAASRPLPEHVVARGQLRDDAHLFTGRVDGQLVTTMPAPVTRAQVERGKERFDIYCAVCHGRTGEGYGVIVQRGFPRPPSFHIDRLRDAPVGHYYEVITNGFGVMYSYASRVSPEDRWAIVSYIRALQLSQHGTLDDADAPERAKLEVSAR